MAISKFDSPNQYLIKKYDIAGPRYTSYPSANHFRDNVNDENWKKAVRLNNIKNSDLSLYFHIPFCDTVCYYCACNRIVSANKNAAIPYINSLIDEIELQAKSIEGHRKISQMHWGGGTPTYIDDEDIGRILKSIDQYWERLPDDEGEYSIEIHPARVDSKRIQTLRNLGFNRLSMGVQDFDPAVQISVNRFNSIAEVERLMKSIRLAGYHSVSIDLIYGLPRQTVESFQVTTSQIIDLAPDRISLFNYAHLPERFKTQRQIIASELPNAEEKLNILSQTTQQLEAAGYQYIGMDHFAKPTDELFLAQQRGELQRNFQGYTRAHDTSGNKDLLAFGISSISTIGDHFFQNTKDIKEYTEKLNQGKLPIEKGYVLDRDDRIRRRVIEQLMCYFQIQFSTMEKDFSVDFSKYFSQELTALKAMANDGLLTVNKNEIKIHPKGRQFARRVCMVFDNYLQNGKPEETSKFSRIV